MPLTPGTRLGNYEIDSLLGAGGMGEVYRARDVRLDRPVAIKALPEAFARDPERLARFEREARLLASVHHAHIATIFGIEDGGGTSYLAIELVEGETLAQRLARGPLAVPAALEVCAQVASAINAAHEQGVVHRDLKPGNVMLTAAGVVKVLDFGLAKGSTADPGSRPDLDASPTVALNATAAGVILGTAPYMSPEQARGQAVDRRTDVWALGCVLYECLTGRQAFGGETTSDVIARILEREPEWDALPAATPPRLRDLLRRCLTRQVTDRPRDAGDLRGEMLAIAVDQSSPSRSSRAADALPSVAVLYFENLSPDSESDYFCAGITEDILTDLSKLKGLRVASRNAVARYRGAAADIPKVASELGVGAVLEGSVRRAGDRVRITAQLLKADGFHLWAERYDRKLDDVFAVQDEIAAAIAGALRVALTPVEGESLGRERPADVGAYDLYLKGREQYEQRTTASFREAIRLFEQAIEREPEYALAWAGIADACGQLMQWGGGDEAELKPRGLEAAKRAIEIDARLAAAHKAHALVLRHIGDRAGSEAALRRAIAVDPRFTPAIGNLAVELFCKGNLAGSERLHRRSLEIDPQDTFTMLWVATIAGCTGRTDEMVRINTDIRRLADEQFYVTGHHMILATGALQRGHPEELSGILDAARADGAETSNMAILEAYVASRAGNPERARRLLDEHSAATTLGLGGMMFAARAALILGDVERAARLCQRPIVRDLSPVLIRLEPGLNALLDHVAFAPRVSPFTLVWPLEAPMMDATKHGHFREVRIESGRPDASDLLKGL